MPDLAGGRQFGLANPERKRRLAITQLLTRIARPLSPSGVGEKQAALAVDDEDSFGEMVQRLTQQRQRKRLPHAFFFADEILGQESGAHLQNRGILGSEASRFVGQDQLASPLRSPAKRTHKEISERWIAESGKARQVVEDHRLIAERQPPNRCLTPLEG
jgi:hypothetical protein